MSGPQWEGEMFKCFCDMCGLEFPLNEAGKRKLFKLGRVTAQVIVAVDDIWNAGHICPRCLEDVITQGVEKALHQGAG